MRKFETLSNHVQVLPIDTSACLCQNVCMCVFLGTYVCFGVFGVFLSSRGIKELITSLQRCHGSSESGGKEKRMATELEEAGLPGRVFLTCKNEKLGAHK